jgi:hypothetical protein
MIASKQSATTCHRHTINMLMFLENMTCLILGWVLPWFLPGALSRIPNGKLLVVLKIHELKTKAEAEIKTKAI